MKCFIDGPEFMEQKVWIDAIKWIKRTDNKTPFANNEMENTHSDTHTYIHTAHSSY